MIHWDTFPKTGNQLIDHDHRLIVDFINLIEKTNKDRLNDKLTIDLLDRLLEFIKAHFHREESVMDSIDFRLRKQHSANHTMLTDTIKMMIMEFCAGGDLSVFMDYIIDDRHLADILNPKVGSQRIGDIPGFGLRRPIAC